MDERLEKALAFSNYRATIENRRTALKRRFETMCILHYNQGMFIANDVTIAFVSALIANENADAIMIDVKENPIKINNLKEFYAQLLNTYFIAVNEYSVEITTLNKARNVKKVMNW